MEKDITSIVVKGKRIGVVGLKAAAVSMAGPYAGKGDDELRAELLRRLSQINYFPARLTEEYGRALLRAYKGMVGMTPDEPPDQPVVPEIRILGPGCARCDFLTREVIEALSELGAAADVDHVTDIGEMIKYGLKGVPALVINGRLVSVGQIPDRASIKRWIVEAGGK